MDAETVNAAKILAVKASHAAVLVPGVLRDSEGQLQWNNIINGVLTAGLIAAGTSLFSMYQTVNELRLIQQQRANTLDQLPSLVERARTLEKDIDAIKSGQAVATSDRFRGSDGERLRKELNDRIDRVEAKLDHLMTRSNSR